MELPVLAEVADLEPGDRVVAVSEGVFHERIVHKKTRGALTLLTGERLKLTGSVLVVREIDNEWVDLTDEVEDPRDRDDLREVEEARSRCERYDLDPGSALYWTVYHREEQWRQALGAAGHRLAERDR